MDINITKPIPDTEAIVTFEKVWYTPSYTYVLYTVTEPNQNYLMASQRVIDIPPEDYARNNLSMEPLSKRWGGVSSEGYHQIMVFMGYHTPVPAQELTLTVSNWIIPEGFIRSDGQVAGLSYESIVPGDAPDSFKFIFSAQPLNQWPGKVSLDIRAIQFKTSEVLNFPVDWSFYVSKEGQIEVTEEQVPAVAFYDGMVRLSSIDPTSWLELEIVEPTQKPLNKQPYIIMAPDPVFVERFNNYSTGLKITITINQPEAHLVVNQEIELN